MRKIGNKFIEQSKKEKSKERDISFHYTNEDMVKELLSMTPIELEDSVLDSGSGKNKVWFNNIQNKHKYECEIEDGVNFYDWNTKVDWVIGNPPFSEGWKFLEKASNIANKGVAFLGNINFFNCLTPKRLQILKDKGFSIQKIHIIMDRRWFGRYYYIVFSKQNNNLFSWNNKPY